MSKQEPYDFIVVGAGTAGSVLASRLANSPRKPRVLLLEAGGPNTSMNHRAAGEILTYWMTAEENYRYKTAPEPTLNDSEIVYDRGRGLGGSSAINIGVWDYGRREEYDEWARLVGDDVWSWRSVVEKMKKIEKRHDFTPEKLKEYMPGRSHNHGSEGLLDVTCPATWQPGLKLVLDSVGKQSIPMTDLYSGDLGLGVPASTTYKGLRTTASTAYLADQPLNLHIATGAVVARVIVDGTTAKGVQLVGGITYFARHDVILCAGAIDTPKLLLLSGIGPADELEKHHILPTAVIPGIGHNLGDHCLSRLQVNLAPGTIPTINSADIKAAKTQWDLDQTGPLLDDSAVLALGYFQLDRIRTLPEFQALDEQTKAYLTRPQTAHFELGLGILSAPDSPKPAFRTSVILMNAMSRGRVSLRSADPADPPHLQLKYLQHPYDRAVMVEAVKAARNIIYGSGLPLEEQVLGPDSLAEEDILNYLRESVTPAWHACGTVKMGKVEDEGTCVDNEFRVVGLKKLRVVDLSVCPVIPSNHTQATAYLIGEVAAEKILGSMVDGSLESRLDTRS